MRLQVTIPDQLFIEAHRVAEEAGVSFDYFVSEAVAHHLESELGGPPVSPELITALRKAQSDVLSGGGKTISEVRENLATNRAAWLPKDLD